MKVIDLVQGSVEWLEYRRWKVGSSDASVCMDINPYKTKEKLLKEKLYGLSSYMNNSMKRGHILEPIVRNYINNTCGTKFKPLVIESENNHFMIASLDGFDEGKSSSILEIKTTSKIDLHLDALNGKVPSIYIPQVQHALSVSSCKQALYVSCFLKQEIEDFSIINENNILDFVEIQKVIANVDSIYCENLIEKEKEFYNNLVDLNIPPDVPTEICNDETVEILSEFYMNAKRNSQGWEEIANETKEKILKKCEYKNTSAGDYKIIKTDRKGSIDYANIPILKEMDLEIYRKPLTSFWAIKKPCLSRSV
jgi:putative phage-type endonuclease